MSIAGINLKEVDYKDAKTLQTIINNINKLKEGNHRYIFIEEFLDDSLGIKDEIETKTGLYFPRGEDLKIYNIIIILEKILEFKDILTEEDILIVCKDKNLTTKIIKLIYKRFPFISTFENIEWEDDIYEDILKDIGLSVFKQKNLNKSIRKYGIIINMEKDTYIDINDIGKETIIFDYSNSYKLRNVKNTLLIEDITIGNKDNENTLLPIELISSLYQELNGFNSESFYKIYSRGKLYTLDELINPIKGLKGSI